MSCRDCRVLLLGYVAICPTLTKMALDPQDASRMRAECNEKTLKVQKDGQVGIANKRLLLLLYNVQMLKAAEMVEF